MNALREVSPASFARQRNKILAKLQQLKNDVDHWNSTHPNEEPITIDFDLSQDIERLRKQADALRT